MIICKDKFGNSRATFDHECRNLNDIEKGFKKRFISSWMIKKGVETFGLKNCKTRPRTYIISKILK